MLVVFVITLHLERKRVDSWNNVVVVVQQNLPSLSAAVVEPLTTTIDHQSSPANAECKFYS